MVDWRQGCLLLSLVMPGTYHGQDEELLSMLAPKVGDPSLHGCNGVTTACAYEADHTAKRASNKRDGIVQARTTPFSQHHDRSWRHAHLLPEWDCLAQDVVAHPPAVEVNLQWRKRALDSQK
ncbi:uncharacterized protein TrAtP1_012367 [Trichoderma atroviride]|uniref:uncharacterized protein n=1 Tax=Hypocrea atroviridis TaxID=63577 RepID=UPI00332836EB|nr:hypothetical protein TrAtP1_012367 [Trichoderma atroviride]